MHQYAKGQYDQAEQGRMDKEKHRENRKIDVQIVSVRMYTQYKGPLDTLSTHTKPKIEKDSRQAEAGKLNGG